MLAPNDPVEVVAFRQNCTAKVLAVLNEEALVEYVLPGGTTSLVLANAHASSPLEQWRRNPYGYANLPQAWMDALAAQGATWKRITRKSSGGVTLREAYKAIRSGWEYSKDRSSRTKNYKGHILSLRCVSGQWICQVDGKSVYTFLVKRGRSQWGKGARHLHHYVDSHEKLGLGCQ